jgi:hypothetical protein
MKNFAIRDKEAGNLIVIGISETEAKAVLVEFENEDRANGSYTPDFYEIVETAK